MAAAAHYHVSVSLIREACTGKKESVASHHLAFLNDYENNSIPPFSPPVLQYCVYKLTAPNAKVYIGMSHNIRKRWGRHGQAYKGSGPLYAAIQ